METNTGNDEGSGSSDATAGEAGDTGIKDILVGAAEDAIHNEASNEADGPSADEVQPVAALTEGAEALAICEVLTGMQSDDVGGMSVYLTVETVGSNTVIRIDADGAGQGMAVPLATLANVTDVTLEQLLNTNQIIT
jgi:hypothetical protein